MHGEQFEDLGLDMCVFLGVEHEKGQQKVDLMPSCRLKSV